MVSLHMSHFIVDGSKHRSKEEAFRFAVLRWLQEAGQNPHRFAQGGQMVSLMSNTIGMSTRQQTSTSIADSDNLRLHLRKCNPKILTRCSLNLFVS